MVLLLNLVVSLEEVFNLFSILVRAETSLRGAKVVHALVDPHGAQSCTSKDWVVDKLEVCRLVRAREAVVNPR